MSQLLFTRYFQAKSLYVYETFSALFLAHPSGKNIFAVLYKMSPGQTDRDSFCTLLWVFQSAGWPLGRPALAYAYRDLLSIITGRTPGNWKSRLPLAGGGSLTGKDHVIHVCRVLNVNLHPQTSSPLKFVFILAGCGRENYQKRVKKLCLISKLFFSCILAADRV